MSDYQAPTGALVVLGSGPGVGLNVAKVFAEHEFRHIILLSRDTARLAGEVSAVKTVIANAKVEALELDLSKTRAEVQAVLTKVGDILSHWSVPLEVVLYNAARVAPSKIGKYPVEALEEDLRVSKLLFRHLFFRY